jgi:hypothetical protein
VVNDCVVDIEQLLSQKASGVFNILSTVMRCGSRGEQSLSMVLEIVSQVGKYSEYAYGCAEFSSFGDIILTAIQLGNNMLSIV